jgi:hypothetical protein
MAKVSAVGFTFARQLHLDLKFPVGLVEMAQGDSYLHAWISRTASKDSEIICRHIEHFRDSRDQADGALSDGMNMAGQVPGGLYASKVSPLQMMAVRGVLWYPGENDFPDPAYYREALQVMFTEWQQVFRPAGSKGLVFFIIQPAPLYYGQKCFTEQAEFCEMLASVRHRLSGRCALLPLYDLSLDYTGAAESWRHPKHPVAKQPVGERLERMALGLLYQRKAPHTAPECSNIEIVGNKMILSFSQIGEGLRLSGPGERLRGFTICGPDRVFLPAHARILYGVRVMVWHDQVKTPVAVAYAFSDMNQEANLVSRDNLPVVPFRSDRRKSVHSPPQEWQHCDSLQLWGSPEKQAAMQAGWYPRWQLSRGDGQLVVEAANKVEGDGSLFLQYRTDEHQEICLEPLLHYASLFPPLDLSLYEAINFDLFNPDQHMKFIRLALAGAADDTSLQMLRQKSAIVATLRWQTFSFPLAEAGDLLAQVRRIVLVIEDRKKKGGIYLDRIRLIRSQTTGAGYAQE